MSVNAGSPLYATQGGGYAMYENGKYVWHSEIPEFLPDAKPGDSIPEEWDLIPVNDAARNELEDDYYDYEDDYISPGTIYSRAYDHFGNAEMAREATEMYPGDFM